MGHSGKFGMRYGPLRQIWLCAMGHCGKFGYTLWATAADLVMRYGPLRSRRSYSKNLLRFLRYGPYRRIWLFAMGRGAGFGYPLWAVAKDLVKR
jgi:hypothetical protein